MIATLSFAPIDIGNSTSYLGGLQLFIL